MCFVNFRQQRAPLIRSSFEKQLKALLLLSLTLPFAAHSNVGWVGTDFSGNQCSGPGNRGRDYTDPRPGPHGQEFLPVVEKKHFKPHIRNMELRRNTKTGQLTGINGIAKEFYYILGQYPNHHEVLYRLSRFPEKITRRINSAEESDWLGRDENAIYSAVIALSERYNKPRFECFFTRALAWKPKDPVLHVLYGIYAYKTGQTQLAEKHYREATTLRPEYADAYYNLGLLYYELEEYEQAQKAAIKAYRFGYKLEGLKRKLAKAGFSID